MEIQWSVRIVDEDGQPVQGASVSVHYPWTHETKYTDDDGWVSFSKDLMLDSSVQTTIYVNGQEVGTPSVEDGDTFSYAQP